MKIEDFLNCFNKSIQNIRKSKGIHNNGHFVYYQYYNKKLGNYYHYTLRIEYIANIENERNAKVLSFDTLKHIIQVPVEAIDREILRKQAVEQLQQALLTSFLTRIMNKDLYKSIIDGTYGIE